MKKKLLGILMVLATAFAFNTAVLAEEEATTEETTAVGETTEVTDVEVTQGQQVVEEDEEAKYFGSAVDFVNEPKTYTFASVAYYPETVFTDKATGRTLVEGEDYIRTYVTTRDKTLNPNSEFYSNPEKYSDDDFTSPGFIWENINFIGKYFGVISIRHNVATYIYIYGDTTSKYEGEEDPELTGRINYLAGYDYENSKWLWSTTDEATAEGYKYDVKDLVSVTREEGEEVGTYVTTPSIEFEEDYYAYAFSETRYWTCRTVPAYVYLYTGKLSIKEAYDVVVNYVDVDGNVIAEQETIKNLKPEEEYKTEEKTIEGYQLVRVDGEKSGLIDSEDITVTYVYEFVMGEGGEEFDVVQTGSEVDYSVMSSALITLSLIGLALYSKKKNN